MRNFPTSSENSKADSDFNKLKLYAQDIQFDYSTDSWTAETLGEKQIGIQKVLGVVSICTVIDGQLFSTILT